MQAVEVTYGGVGLKERVRSGETGIHVSEAEIAEGAEGEDFLSVANELRGLVHGRL